MRDPLGVNNLLREWNKLELDEHGILRRKTSSNLQPVLPNCLTVTIDRSKNTNMTDYESS